MTIQSNYISMQSALRMGVELEVQGCKVLGGEVLKFSVLTKQNFFVIRDDVFMKKMQGRFTFCKDTIIRDLFF